MAKAPINFVLAPGQAPADAKWNGKRPDPIVPPEDVPEPGSKEFYEKFYPPGHAFHGKVGPREAPATPTHWPMDDFGDPKAKPEPPANQMNMDAYRPPPEEKKK